MTLPTRPTSTDQFIPPSRYRRRSTLYSCDPTQTTQSVERKSEPILQPTTVRTRMLPVRGSFGDVLNSSCYKMEVYVTKGAMPGFYLPPETRNMFLTFTKHCGANGFTTQEISLPIGNTTYILEKNNYKLNRRSCFHLRSDSSLVESILQSTAVSTPNNEGGREPKQIEDKDEPIIPLPSSTYNRADDEGVDEKCDVEGCYEGSCTSNNSSPRTVDDIEGESWLMDFDSDDSDQTSSSSDGAGTIIWAPEQEKAKAKVTRAVVVSNQLGNTTGKRNSVLSLSASSSLSTSSSNSMSANTRLTTSDGIQFHSTEPTSTTGKGSFAMTEVPRTAIQPLSDPRHNGRKNLIVSTKGPSHLTQHDTGELSPTEMDTKDFEALVIEESARPKPPSITHSTFSGTFLGSDSDSSVSSSHTVKPTPLRSPGTGRKSTTGSFLSEDLDLRLKTARADVDSLQEPGEHQISYLKTPSHSSLRADRAQISKRSGSTPSPGPSTPMVDHFQEYMTHFDLDNVNNPPAKGFMESDDSSSEDDNASVYTVVQQKPNNSMPSESRFNDIKTTNQAPKDSVSSKPMTSNSMPSGSGQSNPNGQKKRGKRRVKKEKPEKKYIFYVPDNFAELLAQAPTPPPTRPLPPIPTVALAQPTQVNQPTPETVELTKVYKAYLNNTDRDESTKVKCKNKTEQKVGLESDLEAFMEGEAMRAEWMSAERRAMD